MAYAKEVIDGQEVWTFNGEVVAHTPDGLLHTVLLRTVKQAEDSDQITIEISDRLQDLLLEGWPMIADDSAKQFNARVKAVEEFRKAGLIA